VAQAQLCQQEWETVYAVTRTYLTVLYAREQQKVARDLLQILQTLQDTTKGLAGEKGSNVTIPQRDRVLALFEVAGGRQQEAASGIERAKAALREAMGVGPDFPFELPTGQLRANPAPITREQVIALALERRGELGQAAGAAQIAALEVKAQTATRGLTAQTFAAGGDIHAQPIVQGLRNGDYRPGAVGLEMPIQLAGTRSKRVEQAEALGARADSVREKATGLVTLEAEDIYFRYLDWSSRAPRVREASRIAEKRSADVRSLFDPLAATPRATLDDVLDGALLSTQLLIQANEAEFRYLVSLADLERATAGGVVPNYLPPGTANNGASTAPAGPSK
jgi:outer membrane protein TolC